MERKIRMLHYFLIYKPYGVLSQFTKEIPSHKTLGDYYSFPTSVYPVGRLDKDSEGLLILTNDNYLKNQLLDPSYKHQRTYLVQVEGVPNPKAIEQLRTGVDIKVNKKIYRTLPASANLVPNELVLPPRTPPIRYRKDIPTTWLKLVLKEGKNRQIRRMGAAVGFPVLRLVRVAIEKIGLGDLQPGEVRQFHQKEIYTLLNITYKSP